MQIDPQLGARIRFLLTLTIAATCAAVHSVASLHAAETQSIEIQVVGDTGDPVACRVHVRNAEGVPQRAKDRPFWEDHFVCSGRATLEVVPGTYQWTIERGPEHRPQSGVVHVTAGETATVKAELSRIARLSSEGWYGGDMHVHRPAADIRLLMDAEDLDFAPVIDWWNRPAPDASELAQTEFRFGDRVFCIGGGEDEREGGALLYFGLNRPLDLSVLSREYPSPMHFVRIARTQTPKVWIDIEKPFWWDVPTWLAMAKPNSIGIAHNHMHRGGVLGSEAWGRPRDIETYPGIDGNGRWTQQIYYHVLNSGIRIPPSAGSASGVLPNPVGYNRVYVHLADAKLEREAWFDALRSGRCFVTNGPLLRVKVDGSWPGETIRTDRTSTRKLEIQLASSDRIKQLEIIHNGLVVKRIPCADVPSQAIAAEVKLDDAGWMLVRAIADVDHTFRFASTAPWYIGDGIPPSPKQRRSIQFMLDWIDERIQRVNANVANSSERDEILKWHVQARGFWEKRLASIADPEIERE